MPFCHNCGTQLAPDAKFCVNCGTKIQQDTIPQPSTNAKQYGSAASAFFGFVNTAKSGISNAIVQRNTSNNSTYAQIPNNDFAPSNPQAAVCVNCPNCGAPINSFSAKCQNCGTELNNKTRATACQELCNRLDYIESTRPQESLLSMVSGLANKAFNNKKIPQTDQQKIELISNFIVPNTKADMLEFIFLAQTRVKACKKLAHSSDENVRIVQEELRDVWEAKLEQTIEKARLVLSNDADFISVYKNYQSQKFKEKNLCQHCGGRFKGMFKPTCSKCGKPKDY